MLLALMLGLPFTLENPRRSRLWICPPMLALLRKRNVSTFFVGFCMFNRPWKKPTTFAGVHVSLISNHIAALEEKEEFASIPGSHTYHCRGRPVQANGSPRLLSPILPDFATAWRKFSWIHSFNWLLEISGLTLESPFKAAYQEASNFGQACANVGSIACSMHWWWHFVASLH